MADSRNPFDPNRRRILQAGLAASVAGLAFSSLAANALPGRGGWRPGRPWADGYGPLEPAADLATGLALLALPEGFEYLSFGWTGQIMDDGRPTPTDHDGMAVVARRGHRIALVRNHELSAGEGSPAQVPDGIYNPAEFGGTTNLVFDLKRGEFVQSYTSLGGTIRNCAGGPTPWDSWISCEETFHDFGNRPDGFNHGYVFDVPSQQPSPREKIAASGAESKARPLRPSGSATGCQVTVKVSPGAKLPRRSLRGTPSTTMAKSSPPSRSISSRPRPRPRRQSGAPAPGCTYLSKT